MCTLRSTATGCVRNTIIIRFYISSWLVLWFLVEQRAAQARDSDQPPRNPGQFMPSSLLIHYRYIPMVSLAVLRPRHLALRISSRSLRVPGSLTDPSTVHPAATGSCSARPAELPSAVVASLCSRPRSPATCHPPLCTHPRPDLLPSAVDEIPS
jgi:hypothetical protein